MYSDEDMGQAYKEGYESGKADGGYAVLGEVLEEIKNKSWKWKNSYGNSIDEIIDVIEVEVITEILKKHFA